MRTITQSPVPWRDALLATITTSTKRPLLPHISWHLRKIDF